MSATSASDPFYAVRDVLEGEIKQLRVKFDSWKGTMESVNTATDAQFRVKHEDFKRDLSHAEDMVRKVKLAVSNVERNRVKYAHIDDRELAARKAFVHSLESTVGTMRDVFHGREAAAKMDSDARRELHSRQANEVNSAAAKSNVYNQANSGFVSDQAQAQSQIRREQDQSLDSMGQSLDRLGAMAKAIDSELQEQDKIIEDVDRGVEETQGKMDNAIKGIEKMLKTKDRCQLCTIAGLVVLLIIVTAIAVS